MDTPRPALTLPLLRTLLMETGREWLDDNAARLGAALAFYSILSLGPLLLIVISIAGILFGQEAASGHIFAEIRGLLGDDGAQMLQTVLANSRNEDAGFCATLLGLGMLLIAATGFFGELQAALNIIWEVQPAPNRSWWWFIRQRFLSFTMILGIGFLLLVSLVVSAGLSAFGNFFEGHLPELVMQLLNFVFSFAVITLLFAMIFKILPDAQVRWRDVWTGAGITALLFSIGKLLIGLYLGHSALSSTYGAAGSLIIILIWIYYSAQILFLGAEFTQVYARHFDGGIIPARGAVPLEEKP